MWRCIVAVALVAVVSLSGEARAGDTQPPPEASLYHYRAVVTDVYDGDTVTVDVDLGFHVWVHGEKIRLAHIDAPERKGATKAEGLASGDFLSRECR